MQTIIPNANNKVLRFLGINIKNSKEVFVEELTFYRGGLAMLEKINRGFAYESLIHGVFLNKEDFKTILPSTIEWTWAGIVSSFCKKGHDWFQKESSLPIESIDISLFLNHTNLPTCLCGMISEYTQTNYDLFYGLIISNFEDMNSDFQSIKEKSLLLI